MKYLFLLLLCCTANASAPKFHFGEVVGFWGGDFYGNCNGVVSELIQTNFNKYILDSMVCGPSNRNVHGFEDRVFSENELFKCEDGICVYPKKGKKK